jgi:3-mercaptopyruvate sulfurtransferase SseA
VRPLEALTHDQISVLVDMVDEWRDKDRHAELERERAYDKEQLDAFYALSAFVDAEARKRRIIYF